MRRPIEAFRNSARAFGRLARHEAAFREELIALALPAAWLIAGSLGGFMLLIGVLLTVLLVEALNTGLEATCDTLSREVDEQTRLRQGLRFAGRAAVGHHCGRRLGAGALAMGRRHSHLNGRTAQDENR